MTEEKTFEDIRYLISYPDGFSPQKKYPLWVFLHGAGTRGNDIEVLINNSCFNQVCRRQSDRGYVVLAPLCSVNNWNEVMSSLIKLVEQTKGLGFIDQKRVYLSGNSMGGYGTWELASLRPDWFAAIMPVCGGGIKWMAYTLADVPVRTFHGLCDTVVDPIESLEMAKAVNRKGGHAELILYPHLEHNCWDRVYSDEANYDWILQFTTDRDKTKIEELSGEYYG